MVGRRVNRLMKSAGALFAMSASVLVFAPPASAGTLDQSQTHTDGFFALLTLDRAQTFTAGLTGKLDQVDLSINANCSTGPELTVEIRTLGPDGFISDNVLASATIPGSAIPDSGYLTVVFSEPADVVAETTYAIFVPAQEGALVCAWWSGSTANPYPRGVFQSKIQGNWENHGNQDAGFRTYVDLGHVPERCAGAVPVFGGEGADRLVGTPESDLIRGGDGADTIVGLDGDDCLYGDEWRDLLKGGPGNDVLSGAAHRDRLQGARGNDRLTGGPGNDRIVSGYGRDRVDCGEGFDTLVLKDDRDVVANCERIIR